jgi:hypothetical protein
VNTQWKKSVSVGLTGAHAEAPQVLMRCGVLAGCTQARKCAGNGVFHTEKTKLHLCFTRKALIYFINNDLAIFCPIYGRAVV